MPSSREEKGPKQMKEMESPEAALKRLRSRGEQSTSQMFMYTRITWGSYGTADADGVVQVGAETVSSSQVRLMPQVWGPHFEKQGFGAWPVGCGGRRSKSHVRHRQTEPISLTLR